MSSNKEITCMVSGPIVTDSVISFLKKIELPYKVNVYFRKEFTEYNFPEMLYGDLDIGLSETFKHFFIATANTTSSEEHRKYIVKFKEDIPKIENFINELIQEAHRCMYSEIDYLPIPKCEIKYKCSKRRIEVITIRLYYKTKYTDFYNTNNTNGIDFGGTDWKYNVTDILNIILTNHDTDNLTPKGIKEYRNFR